MKKFLALALAGMMVLSMSACGSKDKGGDAAGYKDVYKRQRRYRAMNAQILSL